jgi:hypothetical protein
MDHGVNNDEHKDNVGSGGEYIWNVGMHIIPLVILQIFVSLIVYSFGKNYKSRDCFKLDIWQTRQRMWAITVMWKKQDYMAFVYYNVWI